MKHHTKDKGDLAVSFVINDLTEKEYSVNIPLSEHNPYDLIAEKAGKCFKIQVKYRKITKNGTIRLRPFNVWSDLNGRHHTKINLKRIDFYAVFIPDIKKCFYISANLIKKTLTYRVLKTKNNQIKNVIYINNIKSTF